MCPNGTVDWASKWPKEAFTLDDPKHHVEPDYKHVERVAKEWVAAKRKKLAAANAPPSQAGDEGQPAGAAPQAHVWATFLDPLNRPCALSGDARHSCACDSLLLLPPTLLRLSLRGAEQDGVDAGGDTAGAASSRTACRRRRSRTRSRARAWVIKCRRCTGRSLDARYAVTCDLDPFKG